MSERIPILVIDDDADFLELVDYNLRLDGFDVSQAANGPQGLKLARKKRPAVDFAGYDHAGHERPGGAQRVEI